jgi:hypothetical protein
MFAAHLLKIVVLESRSHPPMLHRYPDPVTEVRQRSQRRGYAGSDRRRERSVPESDYTLLRTCLD